MTTDSALPTITPERTRCSFCGKSADDVAHIAAGPLIAERRAFICNECVGLACRVIGEKVCPIAIAGLRIAAFVALKGWGETGPDGKWASWNGPELRAQAVGLVDWALSSVVPPAADPRADSEAA